MAMNTTMKMKMIKIEDLSAQALSAEMFVFVNVIYLHGFVFNNQKSSRLYRVDLTNLNLVRV